jgi:hypothetical protein
VKRARELIYTAERQASRDISLAGLRPKPGSSQRRLSKACWPPGARAASRDLSY